MPLARIDKRWIQLSDVPVSKWQMFICKLNDLQLIHATMYNDEDRHGLHKYNIHKNEWTFMKYPQDAAQFMQIETMTIDKQADNTKVYFGDHDNNKLMMFDIETQNLTTVKSDYNVVIESSMVNVNGVFHNIGGDDNSVHVAWNSHNDFEITP